MLPLHSMLNREQRRYVKNGQFGCSWLSRPMVSDLSFRFALLSLRVRGLLPSVVAGV